MQARAPRPGSYFKAVFGLQTSCGREIVGGLADVKVSGLVAAMPRVLIGYQGSLCNEGGIGCKINAWNLYQIHELAFSEYGVKTRLRSGCEAESCDEKQSTLTAENISQLAQA